MDSGRLFVAPMGQLARYVLLQPSLRVRGAAVVDTSGGAQLRLDVQGDARTEAPCEDTRISVAAQCSTMPTELQPLCTPGNAVQLLEFEGRRSLDRSGPEVPGVRTAAINDALHLVVDVTLTAAAVCGSRQHTILVGRASLTPAAAAASAPAA